MKKSEKSLLIGLWIFILLMAALWKFWPTFQPALNETTVIISPELKVMFTGAKVKTFAPAHIDVQLEMSSNYQARMGGEPKRVSLGYHLMKKDSSIASGQTTIALPSSEAMLALEVPSPQGSRPTSIQLFLAP